MQALNYRKYSTFSDCYSYGMVLYEIWSVGRALCVELDGTRYMYLYRFLIW